MTVLFFPFSHVSETQQTTLAAFFSQFVFLPLAPENEPDTETGPQHTHGQAAVPVCFSQARIAEVSSRVSAWMNWAALHQGNEQNLKTWIQNDPGLTDPPGPAAIGSELRARMAGRSPSSPETGKQTDPLLFAMIAKRMDAQQDDLDQALAGVEKKQTGLFSRLSGGPVSAGSDTGARVRPDPGAVMTRERIRAWAACAREARLFSGPGPRIFVTTSGAVFDRVAANAARVINALDIDDIKVHEHGCVHQPEWHRQVSTLLDSLAAGPVDGIQTRNILAAMDDSCARTGRIQAQLVEGPDLEKKLNLPGTRLRICRVTLKP